MEDRVLRFTVTNEAGKRAATWRLWLHDSKWGEEIYLACREIGGSIKTSLHASGEWHTAFSLEAHENLNRDGQQPAVERKFDAWPRPQELKPGITIAHRILTPWAASTVPMTETKRDLIQIPAAATGNANVTTILIVANGLNLEIKNGQLVGELHLKDGGKVAVVNNEIPMPPIETSGPATPRYFEGRSKADLSSGGLRAMALLNDPDGNRMLIDSPVAPLNDRK